MADESLERVEDQEDLFANYEEMDKNEKASAQAEHTFQFDAFEEVRSISLPISRVSLCLTAICFGSYLINLHDLPIPVSDLRHG
jgi:hypothetical protein